MSRLWRPSRRSLLQGGAALSLPFWTRRARAQDSGAWDTAGGVGLPKRLIVFCVPQGTVLEEFVPVGEADSFTQPNIMEPLAAFQDRLCVVTGVDNLAPQLNSVGNAHQNANLTVLTGMPFAEQDADALSAGGPSIEQVIADAIGGQTPYPRLDLAIGGSETSSGLTTLTDGLLWHGQWDPVTAYNDPSTALLRIFGDDSISAEDAWALRAQRASVLDKVLRGFDQLAPQVPSDDRLRLESHADKVSQLYDRMVAGTGACTRPELDLSSAYDYTVDDDVSAPIFNDILVTAMACDYTRVGTITFANAHDHDFPWLEALNGGTPIVDRSVYDSWHTMVHDDWVPGAEHVYRWYHEVLEDLLTRLANTTDADGDNMLDTTLVLCISEYSSGRHWSTALPVVLAGNLGGASLGRWLDLMTVSPTEFRDAGGYVYTGHTNNQLFVSLLQAFGLPDETFGYDGSFALADWTGVDVGGTMPQGPLPGLLDG